MIPSVNPPLPTTMNMTVAQRSELIVDKALTALENHGMAKLIEKVPYINFAVIDPYTKIPTGRYQPSVNNFGIINPKAITAESIQKIRIDTGDEQGFRYFTRVNMADYPVRPPVLGQKDSIEHNVKRARNNGFRASAWLETNENGTPVSRSKDGKIVTHGKPVLRFAFPGFEKFELPAAIGILLGGKLNPQVHAVPDFIDETLKKVENEYNLKEKDITAHVTGYSMGVSNGMTAMACLLIRGIPCDTMTATEPFGMKLAHDRITEDLRKNGPLTQNIRRFPMHNFNTTVEKLLNPAMNSIHYHAYRVQETKGSRTTMSVVAGLGGAGNKTLNNETRITMDGYENATRHLWIYVDPLHLNGSIMLQLIKENIKAVAKVKMESMMNRVTPPENSTDFIHLMATRVMDENRGAAGKQSWGIS